MSCECRQFVASGVCYHTGKRGRVLPVEAYRVERDREFEGRFLDLVCELAARLGVPDAEAFRRLVLYRTDGTGAQNYGDTKFLTDDRDLPREARDEAGDGGAYVMFHAEKMGAGPENELHHHLAAAGAHFAAADWHLRLAMGLVDD